FDRLVEAGVGLELKPFGIRAMDSMRFEKSYRMIGAELSIEYAAYESGLDRFVHPNKGDFIGRDALVRWRESGFANQFVTLAVHDASDADALGNNPITADGRLVGRATGGNYGFRVGQSLALAMVQPDYAAIGTDLEMDVLGTPHRVTVIPDSPYDPENARLRS
ncbi:MAG: glycine cleavage T C-terminal barrel domain-containing protein, partial [Pseudomonadota bacterium]